MNNTVLLLATSMTANLFGNVFKKYLSDKYKDEQNILSMFYSIIVSLVSAISLLLFASSLKTSIFTISLAFLFGICTLILQITTLKALNSGPYSYTMVIVSLSTLIPTISGVIIWNETLTLTKIVAIILMLGCIILSVNFEGKSKKATKKWLIYCFIAFLSNGLIGVMQKWHQTSVFKDELDIFLVISFAFSFVCSTAMLLLQGNKKNLAVNIKSSKALTFIPIFLMITSGIMVAINNKLNLFLSGVIESAVFFPIINGGGTILILLSAIIIFKEKLTKRQWLGILLGVLSIILFCAA